MMPSPLLAMTAVVVAITGTPSAARPRAQTPTAALAPAFEVASVKPNASGPQALQRANMGPGDRISIVNLPLRVLIQFAYRPIEAARIVGGPGWIGNDRFDINAKAEAPTSPDQLALMLRTMVPRGLKPSRYTISENALMAQSATTALHHFDKCSHG